MRVETAWRKANADVERRVAALEEARAEVAPRWIRRVAVVLLTVWLTMTAKEAQ